MLLPLLKPFIYLWAGLNFMDDISVVMKIVRLVGASTFHRGTSDPEVICNLCDSVIDNLMSGTDTMDAVPCSWICLGTPKCTNMCKAMKEASETTLDYPCIAAGYCAAEDHGDAGILSDVDCKKGPLFSCEPKKFCQKTRQGFKYTCDLKPGVGRWMHIQKSAGRHTAAIAAGLIEQKRCGEPGAGPYCIAEPSGFSKVLHFLSLFVSLFYGGYKSIIAIETPGGDDDQQWLTFWVIFVLTMMFEQAFARVLLSRFPLYHHAKMVAFAYLIFFDGANYLYRKLRRQLSYWSPYFARMVENRSVTNARNQLDSMIEVGGSLVTDKIALLEESLRHNPTKRNSSLFSSASSFPTIKTCWEYDYTDTTKGMSRTSLSPEEQLFQLSKWILGSEGMKEMEDRLDDNSIALLLERAAPVISFQPRFCHIHLFGTKPGPRGRLPVMDANGKADCYVSFSIARGYKSLGDSEHSMSGLKGLERMPQSVTSRIAYRTLHPEWNQMLEIPIEGGILDNDGNYRNNELQDKLLLLEAWDADCGKWGIALEVFRFLLFALACALISAYVVGVIDSFFLKTLTTEQWWWKTATIALMCYVILGLALSYMMSVVLRADDEFIGSAALPLEILNDQRGHSLFVTLRDETKEGERGILRLKLFLSEH